MRLHTNHEKRSQPSFGPLLLHLASCLSACSSAPTVCLSVSTGFKLDVLSFESRLSPFWFACVKSLASSAVKCSLNQQAAAAAAAAKTQHRHTHIDLHIYRDTLAQAKLFYANSWSSTAANFVYLAYTQRAQAGEVQLGLRLVARGVYYIRYIQYNRKPYRHLLNSA